MFGKQKESGQALVEYALVLPLFLMLLCITIDCAWVGYQSICFDYSYREASWALSVPDSDPSTSYTLTGSDAAEPIMENMEATALGIKRENLSIDKNNASIYQWSVIKKDLYPAYQRGSYESISNYWRYMHIKAQLTYRVYPLTPMGQALFGDCLTYTKNLDKTRLKSINSI